MVVATSLDTKLSLDSTLAEAKLASAAQAEAFAKAVKINTIGDLLRHYPLRYEDRTHFKPIAEVRHGEMVTISGEVTAASSAMTRSRLSITKIGIRDESGTATLVFFNQWFLKKQFEKLKGQKIVAYGRATRLTTGRSIELSEVEWELVGEDGELESITTNRIVPIYPLGEGIKQKRVRNTVWKALSLSLVERDFAAMEYWQNMDCSARYQAVRQMHFPDSWGSLDAARDRLIFEEFFSFQLYLASRKRESRAEVGIAFTNPQAAIDELIATLPFTLTEAQLRVIADIAEDMQAQSPMNRLIQGDVGSGKTVVAMAAILIAVRNGYQAALMAPTEILAEQHYVSVKKLFQALDIPIALLTGSVKPNEKADRMQCVADGIYPVVIGTHALIEENVTFANLGLAIIDEQHRFGVLQRATLRNKGAANCSPDVLVMTATPIPRTLTLTVYGDLDVSIIDSLPPGRKPIKTHWKRHDDRDLVYETLHKMLQQGRQAYVICPLVEESEKLQARAATELAQHLATEVFPDFSVGLVHGQMKSSEKDEAMARFRSGETKLLVSTTVIEVGVDVPNASIIVIEDAERFGLAQLHQLRGRVGRGDTQSYCLLIASPKTEAGEARMAIMARSCDGFEIAEEDLKLRGPGDFYGTRQSGAELLPFVDVVRDVRILHDAREAAFRVIDADPNLSDPANIMLKALVAQKRQLITGIGATN